MMKKSILLAVALLLGSTTPVLAQDVSIKGKRIEITKALDVPELTADAERLIAPYRAKVDSMIRPVLGESAIAMDNQHPESLLGNWAADVLLEASASVKGMKNRSADFAVVNLYGIRSTMPKGKVTIGDILAISPFENRLTILTLTGEKCLELFQQFAIFGGEGVSKGIRLEYDAEGRLTSASLNGKPFEPKRLYTIATLDYLAGGNDNMLAFKDAVKRIDDQRMVYNIYMDFIRKETSKGRMLTSAIEGRSVFQEKPKPQKTLLLVVHTNDTHSCIEPLNPNLSDTTKADKGGYIRRIALLKQLREQQPNLLLFDSGDFSQGSPYYNLYRGDVEIELMNMMKYDAGTIGNHEFDNGIDNMVRLFQKATFPIVCCNYDFTETKLQGIVKPYTIIERRGVKIGVTGVCPPLEGLVAKENYGPTRYLDPAEQCNKAVGELKAQGCSLIVCLSHLGWPDDQLFVPQTHGIDIVLGGHSHTFFDEPQTLKDADGKSVICNQMGKSAQFVGTLQVEM